MNPTSRRRSAQPPWQAPLGKLTLLCLALALVLMAMHRVADPSTWSWIAGLETRAPESRGRSAPRVVQPLVLKEELPAGVFVAAANVQVPRADDAEAASDQSADSGQRLAGVDPSILEGVRDKTGKIPARPYYHLLDVARRTPVEVLEQQAVSTLTFAQFSRSPELYRGQPVLLKGHLRRMTEIPLKANPEGIKRAYEGWLFTEESQRNPYTIIVTRVPDGMPLGGNIAEQVTFAGYFLMLWAYHSGDGDRYAPLLVGQRLVWHPRPARPTPGVTTISLMIGIAAVLFAVLIAVTLWARRSAAATRQEYRQPPAGTDSTQSVQAMTEMEGMSAEEYLKTIEREQP